MASVEAERRSAARDVAGSTDGAPRPQEPTADGRRLADVYADRHERLDEFIVMYAVPARLFRRLGIELLTARGYASLGAVLFLAILIPALAIGLVSSGLTPMLAVQAVLVSAALSALNVVALVLAQSAAYQISAIHRTLTDDEEVRSLMAWDRRWYSPTMSALMGGAVAAIFLAVLYFTTLLVSGIQLSPTTLWYCAVIALFIGQFGFSIAMIFAEFRKFTRARFALYALSPIDTQALRVTSAGIKQVGIVSVVLFPLFFLVALTVLPQTSDLSVPITAVFLLLAYLATAIGTLFPLKFLGDIVKAEKWRRLEPLQARLNELLPTAPTLSETQFHEYEHLKSLHDSIAASGDSLLGLGALARIGGAVAVSTATVIATALIQSYLARLV